MGDRSGCHERKNRSRQRRNRLLTLRETEKEVVEKVAEFAMHGETGKGFIGEDLEVTFGAGAGIDMTVLPH